MTVRRYREGGTAPASATSKFQRPTAAMHMGYVSGRYCARGDQCKHYDTGSGRSQKLGRYHEGDICDRCRRPTADEDLEAHQRTPSLIYAPVRHEENPRKARLIVMKRNLVAQLIIRRGGFWEAVKDVRSRWQLDPVSTRLPPDSEDVLYPRQTPAPPPPRPSAFILPLNRPKAYVVNPGDQERYTPWPYDGRGSWESELCDLLLRSVPERDLGVKPPPYTGRVASRKRLSAWLRFAAACVLFDPPPEQAPAFADYGGLPLVPGEEAGDEPVPGVLAEHDLREAEIDLKVCNAIDSVTTVSNIVRQSAYSGVHKAKANGGKDIIEQPVPAILDEPGLQERAATALGQNKRYPNRKIDRDYLLTGLIRCAHCGGAVTGHPTASRGKKYHYYVCRAGRTESLNIGNPHETPYVNAAWLEGLVWADVKRFLDNPGEVLERLRNEHHHGQGDTEEVDARKAELSKRLAAKQAEKDRYVRAYAQGHISENELGAYLADVKDQLNNLRRLLDSVEGELSQKREQAEIADSTEAWLRALRGRAADVEEGTKEAFRTRRQLVRLLVAEATVGKRSENGQTEVRITYRFGPPPSASDADYPSEGSVFGDQLKNGRASSTPDTNVPTLTVVAVR